MEGSLRLIRILNWKQLTGVARFFFRHPFLFLSAMAATSQCILICDRLFGKTHHQNNKANAFRHALWNMLLVRNALFIESNSQMAHAWAKKLTDWHEDFSPNDELPRLMDLHNNETGRSLYHTCFSHKRVKNTQLTKALLPLLNTAKKLNAKEDITNMHMQLVYLK